MKRVLVYHPLLTSSTPFLHFLHFFKKLNYSIKFCYSVEFNTANLPPTQSWNSINESRHFALGFRITIETKPKEGERFKAIGAGQSGCVRGKIFPKIARQTEKRRHTITFASIANRNCAPASSNIHKNSGNCIFLAEHLQKAVVFYQLHAFFSKFCIAENRQDQKGDPNNKHRLQTAHQCPRNTVYPVDHRKPGKNIQRKCEHSYDQRGQNIGDHKGQAINNRLCQIAGDIFSKALRAK